MAHIHNKGAHQRNQISLVASREYGFENDGPNGKSFDLIKPLPIHGEAHLKAKFNSEDSKKLIEKIKKFKANSLTWRMQSDWQMNPYPSLPAFDSHAISTEDNSLGVVMTNEHIRQTHRKINKLTEKKLPRRLIKVNYVPQFKIKKTKMVERSETQNEILMKIKKGNFKQ